MTAISLEPAQLNPATRGLFEPTTMAGIPLQTSFAMAPMTREQSPDGVPTSAVADYYRRRAEGGVGLIITEGILVDHESAGHETDIPRLSRPASAAGWKQVVDEVHATGGAILAQLWHQGSERSADAGPVWTPSGVREDGRPCGRAITIADIDHLISLYADAARAAHGAGFDGVEIHAAHGYLLDEFLWAATNRRTDRYGGSADGRTRLVTEIVAAVRDATTPNFPVGVRFSQFKEREFAARIASTPDELSRLLTPWVEAGASMLHASTRRLWEPAFDGSARTLAGWAKAITGLPTIAVGSVGLTADGVHDGPSTTTLAAISALRDSGELDLVALGRALLANPAWVRHVGAGRLDELVDYRKEQESVFA
ncbi:12-oxophytodienoate reductase [Luteipulveratus mongoliensis]|uniref:1,2-oxophytodienoate reductase n=1 Tax=Luteipulveratus mongoliensis TaxID=571913 RepID=A0A0K1JF57_9MICO|nr:12-oxophytodienoate reductase [Luteipulveratus mongoliensis]AKU15349.1 1,2-oxophytodienoate reductase [Luteipulveratus mongoliensis]